MDLCFEVHKLANFSPNPVKVNFEGFVQLLRYIKDIMNVGLRYYAKIRDAPLSDILRQARIKTENQLMVFSDSIWKECPDNGIRTGSYILFCKGRPIDHCTHVPGPVVQSSDAS